MEAVILLADSAQTSPDGKLHALGLGWSTTVTPTPPAALAILIRVPWDQANDTHVAAIELLSADGQPVVVPSPFGDQSMRIETEFETGRPPGLPRGTPLDVPLTFNIGPGMPLLPGRYEWKLTVDGVNKENWRADFLVRAQPGMPQTAG